MSAQSTQRHWQENSHQYHQLHLAGAGEEPAAPACRQTFAVLQEHPSRQNSVAPVRAQQGWWAAVQRAEYGGLYAQPMPCNHQQRTECGWHQGYPFVSDCYVVHRVIFHRQGSLGYIEESPRRCSSTGTSWVSQKKIWREIFVLTVLVILY